MRRLLRCVSAALFVTSVAAGLAAAATPGTETSPPAGSLAPPEVLRRFAGVWDATIQMIATGDEPPMTLNGTEVGTPEESGAWIASSFTSRLDGQPFQGQSILTFDRESGKFRRVWADSTSPAFWVSEGSYDAAVERLTMWIESVDSDGHPVRWRETTVFKGADARTFTMYFPGPETTEAAGMTITYHRRAAAGAAPAPPPGPPAKGPSAEHARLEREAGTWKATVESRVDPKGPVLSAKGSETDTLRCAGMVLVRDLVATARGKPFLGHGLLGYDPQRGQYISAWIDSGDPRLRLGAGDYDATGNVLTLTVRPAGSPADAPEMREVHELKSPGDRLVTFFVPVREGGQRAATTLRARRQP